MKESESELDGCIRIEGKVMITFKQENDYWRIITE